MFDYSTLRVIWWVLLGVILIGFAILDGFDLGAQMLVPFVGKSDKERRIVINTIGPIWEGNQVWFILGGGAIFAAWPPLYAVAFSGFYYAMMIVLAAFIMRPVAFKFRSKRSSPTWVCSWDWTLAVSGFVIALILGVAVGNVLQGVPFHFDNNLRAFYTGTFWELLNPFALVTGVLSVCMMLMQGALYLNVKTDGDIAKRATSYAKLAALLVIVLYLGCAFHQFYIAKGFVVTSNIDINGPSMPIHKIVTLEHHAWLNNYADKPWMLIAPTLGLLGAIGAFGLSRFGKGKLAFLMSSVSIFGIIASVGLSMFPFILPSSSTPNHSLLVWDSSSSKLTLGLMLFFTVTFLPIILAYTSWVFYILRGKLTEKFFDDHVQDMY